MAANLIDFTGTDLGVTIAGEALPHRLFEFVLSYSNWTWVAVAVRGNLRGAGGRGSGRAVGTRRCPPGAAQRQSQPRRTSEGEQWARSGATLPRVLEHYGMRSSREGV